MTIGGWRRQAAGRTIAFACLAVALSACGEEPPTQAAVTLDEARTELYAHSCKTCHEDPATGAPRTHDTMAWAPRLAKGDKVLLDNIVNGFNGMPPLGQCIECDADDFLALTHFMAAPSAAGEGNEEGEQP
ncbi:MAG: cytochrome c5 family protein [Parvibaculum sp.]|nr:cytochrome c5 family protein [Parvibaculum sp.]